MRYMYHERVLEEDISDFVIGCMAFACVALIISPYPNQTLVHLIGVNIAEDSK